ncbi:hypothetical protein DFH29DRAFT_881205 [Suillus ampliporus]|nr:hypothetical protein DFH29DRAFT_881205 [Suillus ampliporus]
MAFAYKPWFLLQSQQKLPHWRHQCCTPAPAKVWLSVASSTVWSNYIAVPYPSACQGVIIGCKHQIISFKGRLPWFKPPSAQWCIAIILQYRTLAPAKVWSSFASPQEWSDDYAVQIHQISSQLIVSDPFM